jgi:hypothetical protein
MDLLQSLLDRVRNFLQVDLADDIESVVGHRGFEMPLLCWIVRLEEAKHYFSPRAAGPHTHRPPQAVPMRVTEEAFRGQTNDSYDERRVVQRAISPSAKNL